MIRRSTWILLVFFVILVGFAWLYQKFQASKEENSATSSPTVALASVFQLNDAQVDIVTISNLSSEAVEFKRDTETNQWFVTGIPSEQVDTFKIGSNLAQLFPLTVQETLAHLPPLDSIGLAPSTYTIRMTTSNGEISLAKVGSVTPVGDGYYVLVNSNPVVIVDKLVMDGILDLYQNPPLKALPTTQAITPVFVLPTNSQDTTTPTP